MSQSQVDSPCLNTHPISFKAPIQYCETFAKLADTFKAGGEKCRVLNNSHFTAGWSMVHFWVSMSSAETCQQRRASPQIVPAHITNPVLLILPLSDELKNMVCNAWYGTSCVVGKKGIRRGDQGIMIAPALAPSILTSYLFTCIHKTFQTSRLKFHL